MMSTYANDQIAHNMKLFYKRELVAKGLIANEKISTELMLADALAKALTGS
jgi:hypothetical protein